MEMEIEAAPEFHSELVPLVKLVDERPEGFATGDLELQSAALQALKFVFDLGQ